MEESGVQDFFGLSRWSIFLIDKHRMAKTAMVTTNSMREKPFFLGELLLAFVPVL